MATYKRHSTALKLQLVHPYLNGEGSYKQLAAQHSINHFLLVLWVQKFQRGEITEEQDQAATHECTQDAFARSGLHLGGSRLVIKPISRVKDHAQRCCCTTRKKM